MQMKDAVALAKRSVSELFAEDHIRRLGLEEVEYDEPSGEWRVTLGFSRQWEEPENIFAAAQQARRVYKTVNISDQTGDVSSIRDRQIEQ